MTAHLTRPFRRRRAFAALATLALSASALAGTASASPGSGEVVLSLKGGAENSLPRQGVVATYSAKAGKTGASKRAARPQGKSAGAAQKLSLPVVDVDLLVATVRTGGAISLSLKGQKAALTGVELKVGKSSAAISAKLGKERLVVFQAKGAAAIDGSSVKLTNAPLSLTGAGAVALRKALGLEQLASGRTGSVDVDAKVTPATPAPQTAPAQQSTPPTGGSPDPNPHPDEVLPGPPGTVDPYSAQCNVPAGAAGGIGGTPVPVAGIAPTPTFDVGQDVAGSSIEWGVKQEFRNYVFNVPPGGSLQALEGATAEAAGANMAAPGSFFDFPLAAGIYEAGSAPDGSADKLVAAGTGTMLFCKPGHGFDVVFKNPSVTIDGESSRITADVGANFNGIWYPFQRADIAELDLSAVDPEISDGGNTIVWKDIPATLTADGAQASGLSAFYAAGESLDPITVRTALERPLLAECGIDAGTATPPAVDFTKAALPTLSSPVTGTGGTIDWGFRRATRNTITLPVPGGGSFALKGGASEGYPGNMGGSASPAPTGGEGKFFRFPISGYEYEVGTPDPGDDRLVATSEATVGFCNPNAGNFGVVLSKPTLIVDGASSRLVANAYSFRGGMGWIGGRVDLVNLDPSAVDAVTAAGTVSWGTVPADNGPLTSGIPVSGALLTNALSLASLTPAGTATGWDPVSAQIELPTP